MRNLLQQFIVCAVLASGAVLCQNVPPNVSPVRGGGGTFNCPQERGQFEFPGDCTRYYRCDGGVATLHICSSQLIFNPQFGYCDWPHRVSNPNCAGGPSILSPQVSDICRINPGNPTEAFLAGHPELCNAFYTCSTSFLYAPCTFCGEGSYFSLEARGCHEYLSQGLDLNTTLCRGRQLVPHGEKVLRQLDGSCWPYINIPNPFQHVVDAIRNGGGSQPIPGPLRPG